MIAIASAKASKKEARYESVAKGPDYCAICIYWRTPNQCTKVEGFISSGGWSKYFKRRKNVGKT